MKITNHFIRHLLILFLLFTSDILIAQEMSGTVLTPVYTGGLNVLKEFLIENIQYSGKEGHSGVVTLSYSINEKGNIQDIKILRGIDAKCDSEAVRVTRLIKGWQPALLWGKPIRTRVVMPVEFIFENSPVEMEISVCGNVTDKLNGKPIEGSLVLVKGTNVGAITDKNGYYSFSVPGEEYNLEFSSMGYGTKSEKVGKNHVINVELSSNDIIIDFDENQHD